MTISIYQIQYSDDVVGTFDECCIKYDCRDSPEPEKREIAHMMRFYDDGIWKSQGAEYFGLVSPKFSDKTGISGKAFIEWVEANPGYDVYFINPFPQLSYWHFNVWTQGEFWHPGLIDLANALFDAADLPILIQDLPRNSVTSLLYSNYWVGNERFWRIYMDFVRKLVVAVDKLGVNERKKLYELAPHYAPATYFPFVFERLFSTFLVLHEDITCLSYEYAGNEILERCSNDMERFIVREWAEIIDLLDASSRDDVEYKKLFANLHGMLQIYQSVSPGEKGFLSECGNNLIDKIRRVFNFNWQH